MKKALSLAVVTALAACAETPERTEVAPAPYTTRWYHEHADEIREEAAAEHSRCVAAGGDCSRTRERLAVAEEIQRAARVTEVRREGGVVYQRQY